MCSVLTDYHVFQLGTNLIDLLGFHSGGGGGGGRGGQALINFIVLPPKINIYH